jgi:hypothetical protein
MENSPYFKQAQLMLRVIPHVTAETCFALKGGTAINLFLRDMPRLSIDIDLTYLPLEPRPLAVRNIGAALARIASAIRATVPGTTVQESRLRGATPIAKLFVRTAEAAIKIEPNHVLRGSVFPTQERDLSEAAEALFELSVTARTLSVADLYGGKLCAARAVQRLGWCGAARAGQPAAVRSPAISRQCRSTPRTPVAVAALAIW